MSVFNNAAMSPRVKTLNAQMMVWFNEGKSIADVDIKSKYETHRASTTHHYTADSTNTISAANAYSYMLQLYTRLVRQQDRPTALADLASLTLYVARMALTGPMAPTGRTGRMAPTARMVPVTLPTLRLMAQ